MSEQVVTLRFNAENGKLVAVTRASRAELEGLGKAANQAGQQAAAGARGVDQVGLAAERTQRRASALSGTLGELKGLLAGYAGLAGVRELGRMADTYTDIVGKLGQVTQGERDLATAKAATFSIAQRYYQEFDATVSLYSRAAQALAQYNVGQAKVAELTRTVSAGMLVSRASAAEAASAVLQLSQALGAGALRGEEFNAVNEAAPRLMQALADSLGVPRGALKELAEEGQLTVDVLLEAWTGAQAEQIAAEAEKVPLTISRAWQQARNDMIKFVGEADQSTGASGVIAQAIGLVGRNLDLLATAATIAATAYGGKLLQALVRSTQAFIANAAVSRASAVGLTMVGGAATRLTAAQTAAAVASRALGSALAIVQANPIMVAVTAVALLAAGIWRAADAAEAAKREVRELQEQFVAAQDAYNDFAKAPELAHMSGLKEADATLQKLIESAAEAKRELDDATASYMRNMARFGQASRSEVDAAAAAYGRLSGQVRALMENRTDADVAAMQELQRLAGISRASDEAREALARLAIQVRDGKISKKELTAELARLAEQEGNVAQKAYLMAHGFDGAKQKLADFSAVLKGLDGDLDAAIVNLVRMQQGRYQAWLVEQGQKINAAGGVALMDPKEREAFNQRAEAMKRVIEQTEALEKAQRASKATQRTASQEARQALREEAKDQRDAARAAQELTEAREQALDMLTDWRAELAGPATQALLKYQRMERQLDIDVAAGVLTWKEYAEAMDAVARLRAKDEALMSDQDKAATALQEAQQEAAQEYQRTWTYAIDSVSMAWGDLLTGGIKSFRDFGKELVSIGRRWLADLIALYTRNNLASVFNRWGGQLSSGGFGLAGSTASGFNLQGLFGGRGGNGLLGSIGDWVGGVVGRIGNWVNGLFGRSVGGASAGSLMGFGNNMGNFLGLSRMPWLGALGGALMGIGRGGDMAGRLGSAAAHGAAGYGLAGMAGALSGGAGLSGALGALGPAGWIGLAAVAIDKIAGGKLFGTSYKTQSTAQQVDISPGGAGGYVEEYQTKQRSFFRGRKSRTVRSALDTEALAAVNDLFEAITDSIADAANALAVATPALIGGSFRREFDKSGNLKKEFGTIAGRVYYEAQDAFAKRLQAENLLNVAKQVGSGSEIEQLANRYRGSADTLSDFATLMLAMQSDVKNAQALWPQGEGALTRAVGLLERLAKGGETLAEAYQRVNESARAYGELIAGVDAQLRTAGLNDWQRAALDIETAYRAQVRQANELAKALGLSGARAEDLAKIEQLRAVNMASLQRQMEAQRNTVLQDLELSDLAPSTDAEKLNTAMSQLRAAASAGDLDRAQQLSQTALGYGRSLFASGQDYDSLYNEVTGLIRGMNAPGTASGDDSMARLAESLSGLKDQISSSLFETLTPRLTELNSSINQQLNGVNSRLDRLIGETRGGVAQQRSSNMRDRVRYLLR
ncbi:tape measure protein [Vulcaniibacterium tengchongense]|uniref:Tape measure domain-containing protein n=1 Tax=Vulcaniibacterium tengchongense TaxID=1273429 RepID=A0A3N4VGI6_9GAMM|nr:tape measure protein [Vulcaniibacterium tengchongense]RPE81848.1 tape measure domain-containing protein [Vulcaniibacterium tengchongense]